MADAEGWRVVDHRRQQVRGRASGPGSWSFRGRGNWKVRGRSSGHGRGGRGGRFHAPAASLGSNDRAVVDHSRGGQADAARKRVAVVAPGVTDKGKKRREELCCEICEDNHVPEECPVFNGPKPQAALCGFAGGESGFFQIPTWGSHAAVPRSDGVTAFITVKEGNVSADLVKSELSRLIPVKWNWSVQKHADGFLVPFPCRVELQRMIAMKYVHTLGGEGILVIQEVNQTIEPIAYLQKVWVNVYGVPFEIRSFLPLWAVGSILGATQKVDMRYTRKMGVVRILVAVTSVNHIPESTEIVVGEGLYEIFFKVDKVLKDGKWIDNDNMGNRDGDDKGQGENDDYSKKHEKDFFQSEEIAEDTVMEDNSLPSDSKHPQDGAPRDLELVSQLGCHLLDGSVASLGMESDGLISDNPAALMALISSGAYQ
uniref:DUF4283 domain-containing protein n=1 Tax=Zea mays TaxID=4577 RepID=A0A804NA67_MAIZE